MKLASSTNGMRCTYRHCHAISSFDIEVFGIVVPGGREADCAFGPEECLVVHSCHWGVDGDDEFGGAEAAVFVVEGELVGG